MKALKYILGAGLMSFFVFRAGVKGQPGSNGSSVAKELHLSVGYVNSNGRTQYVKGTAKTKTNGKFGFVRGLAVRFYIKADSPQYLLGKAVTNEKGEAVVYLPPGAKDVWQASPKQHFFVVSDAAMGFPAAVADAEMTKARLQVFPTTARSLVVRLFELQKNDWAPVKGVDVRVAVKRLDGDLNIADAATYTTDSTGSFTADFKQDSLPGDNHGNITLVASVDDNDTYGSISVEKIVPWGVYRPWVSTYDRRSLFARRGRAPLWLDFIAIPIILLVWGCLIYLAYQLKRIRGEQ